MPQKKPQTRTRRSWDEWYRLAKRYREAHGDLLVPAAYVCSGGERLGRWIERQRARYNRVATIDRDMHPEEIELLNAIDMVWKLEYRHAWADWLGALDSYRKLHGNLDIPEDYVCGAYALGNWVVKQRRLYAEGALTARQAADLDARGMLWTVRTRPRDWEDWFQEARAYFEAHGDLMVPPDYQTGEGHRLGLWIYQQRDLYMGRRPNRTLTPEQIGRLEAIGMVWEPEKLKDEAWERMYACVRDYWQANGRLPLWPRNQKSPDGRSLSGWIATQRTALAGGKVDPARREKLAAIGIVAPKTRAAQEAEWEAMYASVADYLSANGALPAGRGDLKAPDGRLMPRWITQQRRNLADGRMPQERVERLARLGIVGANP